ncbi:hypothetical protein DPMN_193978 [Dreissena polymorpha]|uniref:Uncharacterized protein n=1 Tax=Dreissena polymorpha TaxID=45954 RepID=A0A9D3Y361_DREPO|nr:hypothetical protein DPMN_193978 [Dreissena polymorpha]
MDGYGSPGPFRIIPDRDDPWTFEIIERRRSFKDNHNCDNTASTRTNQYHHGQTRQQHEPTSTTTDKPGSNTNQPVPLRTNPAATRTNQYHHGQTRHPHEPTSTITDKPGSNTLPTLRPQGLFRHSYVL